MQKRTIFDYNERDLVCKQRKQKDQICHLYFVQDSFKPYSTY